MESMRVARRLLKKAGTGLRRTCPISEEMVHLAKVGGKHLLVSEQPSQGFLQS